MTIAQAKRFYKQDNKKQKEKKVGNMAKTIYEYFNNYSKEEVDQALKGLSQESLELIRIRYGEDLTVAVNNKLSEEQRKKFYGNVMGQMKRLLANPDIKRKPRRKNNIKIQEADIVKKESINKDIIDIHEEELHQNIEESTKSDVIIENDITQNVIVKSEEYSSEITKDDYIDTIKLFKTPTFEQMISGLGIKESIIISLRMGYVDGKCFSIEAISEFLDIEREEVVKIIKRILLKYKESLVKSIDQAIEIACDDKRKCKI